MITYLRVDNVRSLVNFEWRPGTVNLMVGSNGSGKTSILAVLNSIKQLIGGGRLSDCLTPVDLTWWQDRDEQSISLTLRKDGGVALDYELIVKHDKERQFPLIVSERVSESGKSLFEYSGRMVHLFDDDFNAGAKFAFGSSRSFIPEIQRSAANSKLGWFREYWQRALVLKPDIYRLSSQSVDENQILRYDASNFASWWREIALSQPAAIAGLQDRLPDIIPGAQSLKFTDSGGTRTLVLDILRHGKIRPTSFEALTEGQRVLILLYSIVEILGKGQLVSLDEALNYIAIAEIQPVLVALREKATRCGAQLAVISHHPEVVDYLSADETYLFALKNGISQCKPLREIELDGVRLSHYLSVSDDAM